MDDFMLWGCLTVAVGHLLVDFITQKEGNAE
jgi:hypothetical protein